MADPPYQSIADSLEADERLLPYMPFLLQDLWALGSSVDYIIEMVGGLNLPAERTNVLDLGCGKGAVSVGLATTCGFAVTGVDFMDPFLEVAVAKAEEYKVSHLCTFIKHDITDYVSTAHRFDTVILASIGGVFGTFKQTVGVLRDQVRTGGYMLIDDGYLKDGLRLDRKGYEHYGNHTETIDQLTAFHDGIIAERSTTELSATINYDYLRSIKKRAAELVADCPQLQDDIDDYVRGQEKECEILQNYCEGAMWLLRKSK
jgi:cyclopropane fatty-acyl-phospholipid synthase-like methyltransferase